MYRRDFEGYLSGTDMAEALPSISNYRTDVDTKFLKQGLKGETIGNLSSVNREIAIKKFEAFKKKQSESSLGRGFNSISPEGRINTNRNFTSLPALSRSPHLKGRGSVVPHDSSIKLQVSLQNKKSVIEPDVYANKVRTQMRPKRLGTFD